MFESSILEESFLEQEHMDQSMGEQVNQSFISNMDHGLSKNCSQQELLTFKDLCINNRCQRCQVAQVKITEQAQKIKNLDKKLQQKDKQIMTYNKSIIEFEKKNK